MFQIDALTATHRAKGAAVGPFTVSSAARVECHAPGATDVTYYSAGKAGTRAAMYDRILRFWETYGNAYMVERDAAGRMLPADERYWVVRDIASGEFMRLAGKDEPYATDAVHFSHVIAAENGGAWCPCNIAGEVARDNTLRGARDMLPENVPAWWVDMASDWRGYWASLTVGGPTGTARKRLGI